MAEPVLNPTPAPSPAHEAEPLGQSLVPTLSKETWELLELRIWNSFSKKLWILLTSALTLAALLGLLGLDTWVKAKVDDGLKQQRDEFDKITKAYEARAEAQMLSTGLLFSLQKRFLSDSANYRLKIHELRSKLSASQFTELKKFGGIEAIFETTYGEKLSRDEFAAQLESASAKLPELGAPDKPDTLIGQLAELRLWSVHLLGLQTAIRAVSKDVFEGAKTNPTVLADYYENKIYPEYFAVMKKGAGAIMWAGSRTGDNSVAVNSLMPDAKSELRFFIPSAWDAILK